MPYCEECGIPFDKLRAEGQFITEVNASVPVSYERLRHCLCGACALNAYAHGCYLETCEFCGKHFFPEDEIIILEQSLSHQYAENI